MAQQSRQRFSTEKALRAQLDKAITGWVAEGLVLATEYTGQPLYQTPWPTGPGIVLDLEAVERVLKFFTLLRQLIGRWAGVEFTLLDWQVRYLVGPVFGLRRPSALTGRLVRVIRTVWFEIPRKNGKSTLCSGLALYLLMADREPGAEVYAAAGDKPQAGIVFRAAKNMAKGSKYISEKLGKGIQQVLLEHPKTHSIFRALSSDGGRQMGLNVHGAVIDEVHVHKNPDLIDALETGTGSREQPLIVFITTADDGDDESIYSTKREYVEALCNGSAVDETWFGIVFGVDEKVEGFDPFSDEALRLANPGADVTVLMDYLRGKAANARQSPKELNRYLRLHLNIRTKQTTRWFAMADWDIAAGMIDESKWKGATAYGGLDLSTTTDLTSFVLVKPDDRGLGFGVDVIPMFWLPEERAELFEREHGTIYSAWAADKLITLTEGNVVDYARVREDIEAKVKALGCTVAAIGFDPYNSTETIQKLEEAGFVCEPVHQTYSKLSKASKQLERLILGSTPEAPLCRHAGHKVLRWNADCVEIKADDDDNIKPVKPKRHTSSKRIDGIVALIMAIYCVMVAELEEDPAGDFMREYRAQQMAS